MKFTFLIQKKKKKILFPSNSFLPTFQFPASIALDRSIQNAENVAAGKRASQAERFIFVVLRIRNPPYKEGLVENEEQGENKKMKSIVVEEQEQKEGTEIETGKSEEQDENKKMKSIVVEEQEQEEEEEGSESGFVDLDPDTLRNVLKRVDVFTLGRAACVNKMWRKAAWDNRLWQQIFTLHYVLKRVEHSQLQLF